MKPVDPLPKPGVHYTAPYLMNPTNPLSLNLIGAGGTGSQMLTLLARMNHAMPQLGHPGFDLRLWDGDVVSEANLGRQLFAEAELGLNKATALINRTNRFFGTNWKAIPANYERGELENKREELAPANLFISCVDTLKARIGIAEVLIALQKSHHHDRDKPYYWMDFGNSQQTGQVILSTVGTLPQPESQKFKPVGELPFVTEEFAALLAAADSGEQTPSCSLAEALTKQDLFINSTLANLGCSLLWSLMRTGLTHNRGLFLNLTTFRTVPLTI
jgi:PRTRC genetic system ThiF family protein